MKDKCGGLVCSKHMNCEDFKDSSEKFVLTSLFSHLTSYAASKSGRDKGFHSLVWVSRRWF